MNKFYVVHREKETNRITKANIYTQWTQDVLIKRLHGFNEQRKEQFAELVDNKRGNCDGVSYRMDRIKCLGNSVIPIQAKEAFKRLINL